MEVGVETPPSAWLPHAGRGRARRPCRPSCDQLAQLPEEQETHSGHDRPQELHRPLFVSTPTERSVCLASLRFRSPRPGYARTCDSPARRIALTTLLPHNATNAARRGGAAWGRGPPRFAAGRAIVAALAQAAHGERMRPRQLRESHPEAATTRPAELTLPAPTPLSTVVLLRLELDAGGCSAC